MSTTLYCSILPLIVYIFPFVHYLHVYDSFAFAQLCDTIVDGCKEGAIEAEEEDVEPATETERYPVVGIDPVPESDWIVFLCDLFDRKAEVDGNGTEGDRGQCAKEIVEQHRCWR